MSKRVLSMLVIMTMLLTTVFGSISPNVVYAESPEKKKSLLLNMRIMKG